jgi:hypothetical protein
MKTIVGDAPMEIERTFYHIPMYFYTTMLCTMIAKLDIGVAVRNILSHLNVNSVKIKKLQFVGTAKGTVTEHSTECKQALSFL